MSKKPANLFEQNGPATSTLILLDFLKVSPVIKETLLNFLKFKIIYLQK